MKKTVFFILAVFSVSIMVLGCSPAKKPAPAPNQITQNRPQTDVETNRMPTKSKDITNLADKLAKEAAKVNGVKKATVVLTGTNAYVGIDLNPNLSTTRVTAVKKEVADKVKKADKRLTDVYVTSDVGIVTRIKDVANGIRAGKPVSTFVKQIDEIGRRIVPNK